MSVGRFGRRTRLGLRTRVLHAVVTVFGVPIVFATGCLTPSDVRMMAQGQLISFVNALFNASTSDALQAALGG